MDNGGVVITNKEVYHQVQKIEATLERLVARMESLEEKMETSIKADERSREALQKVEGVMRGTEALKERVEKVEGNQTWLWRTVIAGLVTGAMGALFLFVKKGIGG